MSDCISRQSAIFLANDLKQDLPDDERIADMVMARNEGILEYQTQLSLLPPVNPQEPKTDVLDKIRAEIEKPLHDERCFDTADAKAQYIALNWCIEIIDKYKAESEA